MQLWNPKAACSPNACPVQLECSPIAAGMQAQCSENTDPGSAQRISQALCSLVHRISQALCSVFARLCTVHSPASVQLLCQPWPSMCQHVLDGCWAGAGCVGGVENVPAGRYQ